MANSYNQNQNWDQSRAPQYTQSFPQLEHELEFSTTTPPQLHQRSTYPNSYQFHHSQFPPSNDISASSSSLHGVFAPSTQPPMQQRTASLGANGQQARAFPQGNFTANSTTQSLAQMNRSGAYQSNLYNNNYAAAAPSTAIPVNAFSPSDSDSGVSSTRMSSSPGRDPFFHPSSSSAYQQPNYFSSPNAESTLLPQSKRQRQDAGEDLLRDDDQEGDMGPDLKEGSKAKASGACARCKNLKVKCEFKTDTDPCKRCLNGGHECVIPGRKKRRTPPKREHLLNQIREQAAEIQKLMAKLESTNRASTRTPSHSDISSPPLQSPVLSPSSTSGSYFDPPVTDEKNPINKEANKAVEDWIEKAKESLQDFDAFIGNSMPKNYVVDEDLEELGSVDDDEYVNVEDDFEADEHYGVFVEDPDGEDMQETGNTQTLRHRSSGSSLSTTGASVHRKKNALEGSKPATLPVEAAPFGLFAKMNLKTPRSRTNSGDNEDDKTSGIANANFFKSTPDSYIRRPDNLQHQAPHILTRGIITPQEAEKLFQIYFDRMNMSVSLLDPVLYTAQRTFYRSPFLFTVICAIASRFYSERPELYSQAMHYAQLAAGTALISGNKNVEMCQAYILLSLYPIPARKWEDQRSWLYLGLAIRAATDLNLHLPTTAKPLNENHAREMLNRTRVWLNCFNLDRSTGSQYGKPPIISSSDYMANHSQDWWKSSPFNMKNFDIHISAYNSELKVMGRFISKIYSDPDHPTGLNRNVDFEVISTETDEEFKRLWEYWWSVLEHTDMSDVQNSFRTGLLRLAYSYARLIALSYGFQHAFGKNNGTDENPFLLRCLNAAEDVVNAVVHDICRPNQLRYWRHGPEAQSVFVTFASAFLVKLLQPKFAAYLPVEKRVEIRNLVQKVIDLLSSPEIAIDERHGPKLYSRFLKNLLAAPMARIDPTSPSSTSHYLPRQKTMRPKMFSEQQSPEPFEIPNTVFNHPSPLSPPATQAALSFDNFAPIGAIDPFAPEIIGGSSININNADDINGSNIMLSGLFTPELPFDNDIMQSMQSLTDPSGWQDIALPEFNWMPQFTQNLGLDLRPDAHMYDQNVYMSGPSQ